jgi:hypothetical protein
MALCRQREAASLVHLGWWWSRGRRRVMGWGGCVWAGGGGGSGYCCSWVVTRRCGSIRDARHVGRWQSENGEHWTADANVIALLCC